MPSPIGIFSSRKIIMFDDMPHAQQIILSEGTWALQGVLDDIQILRRSIDEGPAAFDPALGHKIRAIVEGLALASLTLFERARQHRDSGSAFERRAARVAFVEARVSGERPKLLTSRTLRNALVHADEYLDRWLHTADRNWVIDVAVANEMALSKSIGRTNLAFYRVYLREEDEILHLDQRFSLTDAEREAVSVLRALGIEPVPANQS